MFRRVVVVALILGVASACRPDDQRTDTADPAAAGQPRESWDPDMVAHLDAGNAAVRLDSFDVARDHFVAVTVMAPDVAAGWFGLYLAEQGRGDAEAATAALERAQDLEAGANLIHPDGEGDQR